MIRRHRDMWDLTAPSTTAGRLLTAPPEWYERALCAQADPEAWYPERGGTTRPAKAICERCPVREECLAYALENGERWGIWGGLSERQRRNLKAGTGTRTCRICEAVYPVPPQSRRDYCGPECRLEAARRRERKRSAA